MLKANKIAQLLADPRLTWLAEAYQPSLQLYGVAKVAARTDGALKALIDPMAEIFPGRRQNRKTPEDK